MRLTSDMRKAINTRLRQLCGANPTARVGRRESGVDGGHGVNGLNWVADNDLWDAEPLRDVKEIDDCPDLPGAATLDLYVDSGVGHSRELECNAYVTIKDGVVVDVHTDNLTADERTQAILGRPFSR